MLVATLTLVASGVTLDAQQRKWIFQTQRAYGREYASPTDMDEVWIDYRSADDGHDVKLHGLWDANPNPDAPVLLFLHGARRTVDGSASRIRRMRDLGFSALAIDYRGWCWLPVTSLIAQRFESMDRIGRVKVSVLVVHGASDRLIPPALGRELYERATAPKRFVLVEGGNHYSTNSVGQPQYRQGLHELFGWPR